MCCPDTEHSGKNSVEKFGGNIPFFGAFFGAFSSTFFGAFFGEQLSGTGDSQRDSREPIRANHSQLKPLFL